MVKKSARKFRSLKSEVGASPSSGPATATNLSRDYYENKGFFHFTFKTNTVEADCGKKSWFLFVLFRKTYHGVPPIFRTIILMHMKEIGLFIKIILGSWGATTTKNLNKEN